MLCYLKLSKIVVVFFTVNTKGPLFRKKRKKTSKPTLFTDNSLEKL